MMDLTKAKDLVKNGCCTLVVFSPSDVITSSKKGVAPLVELYEGKQDISSFYAVDKVVGKVAAFMYILLGIKNVYAFTISKSALELLKNRGIAAEYEILTDRIINRAGTGFCPLETAVWDTDNEQLAYDRIISTLKKLGA